MNLSCQYKKNMKIFNVDKDKKYFFGVELFKLDYI